MTNVERDKNNIGAVVQYFREFYQISQGKLCKGLCSIATFSRIEAGERDVDALLLETLLERLGRTPNRFELILTDQDYVLYQKRERIKELILYKSYDEAFALVNEYETLAASKGSVHRQFIISSKALLNEINGGDINTTIDLFMEAILCTIPKFKSNNIKEIYLSNSELHIIIDVIERMISAGMTKQAEELLNQILKYLDLHKTIEENNRLYPKVAIIASRFYLQENNLIGALYMCNKGLDKNKGNRKMDYLGELTYIKAQTTEALLKTKMIEGITKQECLKLYKQAYYVYSFCEEHAIADNIKKYLREEYQWEDIN